MIEGLETQKSFVNTWECDENAHLNVQFYWKRFGDAAKIYAQISGAEPQRWTERHVRYHDELPSGAVTTVHSAALKGSNILVHILTNGSGGLSATAQDFYAEPIGPTQNTMDTIPEAATPRGIAPDPLQTVDTASVIKNSNGLVSHLSVVLPSECDEEGVMLDQFHIARFSEAASQFWNHLGISIDWLLKQNLGSVAVEMKATRHALPRSGMITEIVSWLGDVREKTFTFHHQVRDVTSDTVLYNGAVTALLIDLDLRKTVPLPEKIQELSKTQA